MDAVLMVLGALVGIGGGAGLGFLIGKLIADRPAWLFWVTAVLLVAAGTGLAFLGLQMESDAVFVAGVGVIGGSLTALKYGARKVPAFPGAGS